MRLYWLWLCFNTIKTLGSDSTVLSLVNCISEYMEAFPVYYKLTLYFPHAKKYFFCMDIACQVWSFSSIKLYYSKFTHKDAIDPKCVFKMVYRCNILYNIMHKKAKLYTVDLSPCFCDPFYKIFGPQTHLQKQVPLCVLYI